jgi:hypothetical protein
MLVIVPFGLVFGVVAAEAGLDLAQVMAFSMTGDRRGRAADRAAVDARGGAAADRRADRAGGQHCGMAMYSASLLPHLGAGAALARARWPG